MKYWVNMFQNIVCVCVCIVQSWHFISVLMPPTTSLLLLLPSSPSSPFGMSVDMCVNTLFKICLSIHHILLLVLYRLCVYICASLAQCFLLWQTTIILFTLFLVFVGVSETVLPFRYNHKRSMTLHTHTLAVVHSTIYVPDPQHTQYEKFKIIDFPHFVHSIRWD